MNITELKKAHKDAGGHFFDKATMEFFNSRIESRMIGGRVFITSEQFEDQPRGFKVRVIDPDDPADIKTLSPDLGGWRENWDGSFLHYGDARQFADDYVKGYEYVVQCWYSSGWETVTHAETLNGARAGVRDYRHNDSHAANVRYRRVRKS